MADECTLLVELEQPVNFIGANATGVEKGSVMKFADPMTSSISNGDTDIVAGILQSEKIASDGITSHAIYRRGIFKGVAGVAGVTAGHSIITDSSTSSANRLVNSDVNSENILGTALQTATSGNSFVFELNPFHVNLA